MNGFPTASLPVKKAGSNTVDNPCTASDPLKICKNLSNQKGPLLGEVVKSFYVVLVNLRSQECEKKNLSMLSRLIGQNMLFILEHNGAARLAAFRAGKVLESREKPLNDWRISLAGLNLDSVWENIIIQIGNVTIAEGNTLDEQIAADDERAKMLRRIEQLEKQARSEKQPRRKWELAEEAKKLKTQMEVG